MKALSGKDPWWSLIVWGEKRIETRGWSPALRTPFRLALHISARLDPADRDLCGSAPFYAALNRHGVTFAHYDRPGFQPLGLLPAGHIVAVCTVARCERMTADAIPERLTQFLATTAPDWRYDQERAFGYYERGRWAWLLTDVRPLATPVPAKGSLGLWDWTPPAGLLEELCLT